jgi:cellulose synthase/poly-beta-1,6-N-acetylglucosamine synthase-like glycosyltransferase
VDVLLTGLALLSVLYWVALAIVSVKTLQGVRPPEPEGTRTEWPRVSLVVPARNEEAEIEAALRSKLADDYPALEVVFVDDRSTDATGARARAVSDPRLKVTRVDALPEGWLGKVHAMQRGLEQASGEWILFSDADVRLAPGTLRRVVAQAEREGLDHVSLLPGIESRGGLIAPALGAFFRVVILGGRMWAIADPRSSAAGGVGAFNLVRRSALAKSPGLEWLKMEIGDDMALGMMLKRSGARSKMLHGADAVRLEFYPSYRAMARAVEKNGVAAPFWVMAPTNVLLVWLEAGFLGLPLPFAAAAFALAAGTSLVLGRWSRLPAWPALFPPLGMALLAAAMLRSATLALVRGGVMWRGTFYPTRAVREGNRLGIVPDAKN